ncbi:flavin-containing monooxygenase [Sciscionella marina]|uniref:flavin-containing monooxygenase n=1 Tax=Sciscionella marina TaxID=508770 RepID=UPI00037551C7|nr:NAD(P)/FAD-dependent oxidoreductase [Sciscionella marina]
MEQNDPVDVLVIGAGFAGIYAVHAVREAGFTVRCLEAGAGVGGTWYFNRYPGARCDVESIDYSYSFDDVLQQEWKWSERYATQPEILAYINHVVERFGLHRDIRLNCPVVAAHFDEHVTMWRVRAESGEEHSARYLFCATGSLSAVNKPDIPGIDRFRGRMIHTARWPEEGTGFEGMRVGVIGTGSSGIQSIPILAREAEHLTVFQRTPNWSVPAFNRPLTEADQTRIREEYPRRRRVSRASSGGSVHVPQPKNAADCTPSEREQALERGWRTGGVLFGKTFPDQYTNLAANGYASRFAERKIRAVIDDPATADILIPKNQPIGAKRICTDSGYYETFNRADVSLVDLRAEPIRAVTETGIETDRSRFELDVLVFATGFDAMTGALNRIDLRGAGGRRIQDAWQDGPVTYLGYQVPAFPNLFLLNGPGSPSVLANMVLTSEAQVDWLVTLLRTARQQGTKRIEARSDAAEKWTTRIDEAAEETIFVHTDSWYLGSNIAGKPRRFMMYPLGLGNYRKSCDEIAENDYEGFMFDGH